MKLRVVFSDIARTVAAAIHQSHYQGKYTVAGLTGVGAFVFAVLVSFTPMGRRINELAKTFLLHHLLPSSLKGLGKIPVREQLS